MTNTNYHEQVLKLEELCRKYEQSAGKAVDSELKAAILLRSLPGPLRTHVSVNCKEDASYEDLREVILRYERATQKWTTQLVVGTSSRSDPNDTSGPMDVDRVWEKGKGKEKGKYKGKGKDHKGGYHGKGGKDRFQNNNYDQNHSWRNNGKGGKEYSKGKGKFWGKDKGKGKGKESKGKGKGEQRKDNVPYNNCKICGKPGHWSKECWMNKNRVNQVDEGTSNASSSTNSTVTMSSSRPQTASVKRIFNLADECERSCTVYAMETVSEGEEYVEDEESWWCRRVEWYALDEDDECPCEELPQTLEVFDLTCEDALPGDDEWSQNYVRVLEHGGLEEEGGQSYSSFEVVLDSGADVSVMPESWLHMGIGQATSEGQVQMLDAQGVEMPSLGTRLITLDMGPACIQERFHASTVGSPLLSLGRLLKQGWTLDHRSNMLCLCNEEVAVPVNFKKNSLTHQHSKSRGPLRTRRKCAYLREEVAHG